jgi:hypothetical protein
MVVALRQSWSASRPPVPVPVLPVLLVVLGLAPALGGCRYFGAGIDPGAAGAADAAALPDSAPDDAPDAAPDQRRPDLPPPSPEPPPGFAGAPAVVGCADGTREGFVDPAAWRRIAGCSGAWSVPGVRSAASRARQCGGAAGNSSEPPSGPGCSVADLCAAGWHVCEDGEDVRRSSPTGCESAIQPRFAAFFLTRAGATAYGLCAPDTMLDNDVHGCGSYGQAEVAGCQPLNRRLTFADCLASAPGAEGAAVWACGGPDHHLGEAALVTKATSALGGVLCCLDP